MSVLQEHLNCVDNPSVVTSSSSCFSSFVLAYLTCSLQQGIELYEAEQFKEAVQVWKTALTQEDDKLGKSFILSNLSLAYQNLGQWQEAEKTITNSLEILKNLDITTATYSEILAKALNSQGHLQWLQGNFQQAIANCSASYSSIPCCIKCIL